METILVDHKILVEQAQMAERLCELIQENPHSFEVNSLAEYLHHGALQTLKVYSSEEAQAYRLKMYLLPDNSGRIYV